MITRRLLPSRHVLGFLPRRSFVGVHVAEKEERMGVEYELFGDFSKEGTFGRQDELPRLPVPTLEHTFNKYLTTIEPYLKTEAERQAAKDAVKQVLADPEVRRRHEELLKRRETKDSWLKELWTANGYMAWKAALPINSNVTGYLFGEFRKKWDQAFSAAAVTHGALKYHIELLNGTVPVNMNRDKPNCMDQYTRIFSHTRIPGVVEDNLVKYHESESKHINIIAGGRIYTLQVVDENRNVIPLELLQASIMEIQRDWKQRGDVADSMCVLTGTERTKWAHARGRLLADPKNASALDVVERAIFSISLEPGVDETDDECAFSCFVGNGRTTWFDKSFQLKFKEDGNPSINIEHSWADAPVPLDMFFNKSLPYAENLDEQECINKAKAVSRRPSEWPKHSEVQWNLTDQVREDIRAAESEVDDAIADSDVCIHRCPSLGKNVWKQAKISPDAAVQMAMQLAYRRFTGAEKPVATYETIGMVSWLCGRTETCRVVSSASERFVKTALNGYLKDKTEANRLEAEKALREACDAHIKYIVDGQKGEGIDRHMFGLRLMSKDGSQPDVFQQPVFSESGGTGGFILSTSNNSYIPRPFGGLFGTVMPNGYGICYIPGAEEVFLCLESKHSCKETDSHKFALVIEQCLHDIAAIAGVQSSKI